MTLDHISTYANSYLAQPVLTSMCLHNEQDQYRSDTRTTFYDPLVTTLLSLPALKRLAGIGFLGAIDYLRHGSGRAGHRRRHNRLEHSVGVARLADIYAGEAGLSDDRRRLLLCAALLHDLGHGPLSHTLEPVFSEEFGLDHHIVTRRILKGDVSIGDDIQEILSDAGVNLEEVLALIDGEHDGDVGYLFSSQINLDTLEGITRCRAFVARRPAFGMSESIVRKWAQGNAMPEAGFDAFWALKHDVYNLFIGAPRGAVLDAVAQTYMRANKSDFSPEDFFVTESALRRRHPKLYGYLRMASLANGNLNAMIPSEWKRQTVRLKKRAFFVEPNVRLADNTSIDRRYRQSNFMTCATLAELLD
jgi:hypothetical protein